MTSVISCCAVLLVLIYMTVIHYFKRHSDLSQLKWDMQTITPSDYTMQLEITDDMWVKAKECLYSIQKHKKQLEDGKSLVSVFKVYMKEELQRILTNQLKTFKSEDETAENEAKKNGNEFVPKYGGINIKEVLIADIVFAFDNAEMITLLKKRGEHIMFNRYDQSRQVEEQIIELKNRDWPKLIRPVDAFITFQQEDGMIVAD